jgi:hypothetical protein
LKPVAKSERFVLECLFTRCPDVPGAWLADCVPLNVVTQGDNLCHAIDMLCDAVKLSVEDDLAHGRAWQLRRADPDSMPVLIEARTWVQVRKSAKAVDAMADVTHATTNLELVIRRDGRKTEVACTHTPRTVLSPAAVA